MPISAWFYSPKRASWLPISLPHSSDWQDNNDRYYAGSQWTHITRVCIKYTVTIWAI